MLSNKQLTEKQLIIYNAVKSKVILRREKLIENHGINWRKHEVPFTENEIKSIEKEALINCKYSQ